MGKQAYVRLAEHGKQQNPFLHISAAGGKSAAKSLSSSPAWVHSAVSTLNSKKLPDGKLKQQFTVTHLLLLHTYRSAKTLFNV